MAMVEWNENLSVKIDEIDEQHKKFLDIINKIAETKPGDRTKVGELLNDLIDYAAYHFSTEERLMDESKAPQAEKHKESHARFVAKVSLAKKDFDRGKEIDPDELMEWAGNWMVRHIMRRDKLSADSIRCGQTKIMRKPKA
ncbi:MAG TPA: bacteriohemerythrin [Planctomycetota bacterium]|jgi:hemerythrin-like metal-binding protein